VKKELKEVLWSHTDSLSLSRRNFLILVFGVLLGGWVTADGQVPAKPGRPELCRFEVRETFAVTIFSPSKVLVLPPPYKTDRSLESRLSIEEIRTPFLTESHLPVVHFWNGRSQVEGFDSTAKIQNVQLGPSRFGLISLRDFRPSSHDQEGVANSVGSDGISLRFSFGRDVQTRKRTPIWRCAASIIGKGRGCPL